MTTPDWGNKEIGYLAENAETSITLAGMGPKVGGTFTLLVNWSGSTLDGQKVEGSREIALDVSESNIRDFDDQADSGDSPYITVIQSVRIGMMFSLVAMNC